MSFETECIKTNAIYHKSFCSIKHCNEFTVTIQTIQLVFEGVHRNLDVLRKK